MSSVPNCPVAVPPDLAYILGPQLMGFLFNWGLYGVLTVQIYIYHITFPNDRKEIKILVYGLWVAESVQTGLATSDAFHWLVYGWGQPAQLDNIHTSWFNVPVMGSCIAAVVQLFFCWRIWVLGKSPIVPIIIALVTLTQCGAGVTSGVLLSRLHTFEKASQTLRETALWLSGSALADILITISMTYLLTRSKTTLFNTDRMINKLIRLTIETGGVTMTCAVIDVILFTRFQHNNLHICPATTLAKLYSNTLLVIFNNRAFLTKGDTTFSTGSDSLTVSNFIRGLETTGTNATRGDAEPQTHRLRDSVHKVKTAKPRASLETSGPVYALHDIEHSTASKSAAL